MTVTDASRWQSELAKIDGYVKWATVKKNIIRFAPRDEAQSALSDHAEMLDTVSEDDINSYAFEGVEGERPSRSSNVFCWWYYTEKHIGGQGD